MADTLTAKLQPTNVPQTSPKLPARNLQVQCLQLDEAWLWKKGLMMWWILVLKVFLSQYFYVPEDLISRENCNRRCGAPGSRWKGASQPHRATLVHTSINPEPSCSSPGTFSWPWLLQSKTKLRKEGKLTGCQELAVLISCCSWANNPKYLYSWSQEQSCFWSRDTSLAQKQLRRGSILFYLQLVWSKKKATWSSGK